MKIPTLVPEIKCACGQVTYMLPGLGREVVCIGCGKKNRAAGAPVTKAVAAPGAAAARAATSVKPAVPVKKDSPTTRRVITGAFLVDLSRSAAGISLPTACACCLSNQALEEKKIEASRSWQEGNTQYTERLHLDVPFCQVCHQHAGRVDLRIGLAVISWIVAVGLSIWAIAGSGRGEFSWILALIGAPFTFTLAIALGFLFVPRQALGDAHAEESLAAAIALFDEYKVTMRFYNNAYGALFAAQNQRPVGQEGKGGFPMTSDSRPLSALMYGTRQEAAKGAGNARLKPLLTAVISLVPVVGAVLGMAFMG